MTTLDLRPTPDPSESGTSVRDSLAASLEAHGQPDFVDLSGALQSLDLPAEALTLAFENISAGGNGKYGRLELDDEHGRTGILLEAGSNDDEPATAQIGYKHRAGRLSLFAGTGENQESALLTGSTLSLGGGGAPGGITFRDGTGEVCTVLFPNLFMLGSAGLPAGILIGGSNAANGIRLTGYNGTVSARAVEANRIRAENDISVGGLIDTGALSVRSDVSVGGNVSVVGDISLSNGDVAEEFDLADDEPTPLPGAVMIVTDEGLRASKNAYDTRAVGALAGGGLHRPGLVLDRGAGSERTRVAITLMGKVSVLASDDHAPIRPGDLLVSSEVAGHVMRGDDVQRRPGAVLGKALTSRDPLTRMVSMLACLR